MRHGWTFNFFGILLTRNPELTSAHIINHELIHTAQMREMLWIPFYIFYGVEWIYRFAKTFNASSAYRNVSFEREAYDNDRNPDYLHYRKHFGQWRKNNSY